MALIYILIYLLIKSFYRFLNAYWHQIINIFLKYLCISINISKLQFVNLISYDILLILLL